MMIIILVVVTKGKGVKLRSGGGGRTFLNNNAKRPTKGVAEINSCINRAG